jgi:glutamate 5-kinase
MLAAVGQPHLMAVYTQLFSLYQQKIAQVLLTRDDLMDRRRYLNARNTLEALLAYGIIPVINENDTIATEEIRFGDNDQLSALVTTVLEADYLLLLTDQDGVFTSDPSVDPEANLVKLIEEDSIPDEILKAVSQSKSELGTGGMASKLQAAQLARRSGAAVIIANGATDHVLTRLILESDSLGTHFTPLGSHMESRKRFLLAGLTDASGKLIVDEGAVAALRNGGSLLPVGIKKLEGRFTRGQSVIIADLEQHPVAVGLCNYGAEDIEQISGQHSDQIESLLGYAYGSEVVHHNNLVLL